MIAAVAAANPRTVVVLQTGGPVLMPWLDRVGAVLEAWYPAGRGGQAIASVLTGRTNPSGRLPVTFPAGVGQLPRPAIPGGDVVPGCTTPVPYAEGADIGYRWFARRGAKPLFPFGYGLTYTSFGYSDLSVTGGETVTATFTVRNTGAVAGADVPQVYLTARAGEPSLRLLGWDKVQLAPGESRRVTVTANLRLLARFDGGRHAWHVTAGAYQVAVGASSADLALRTKVTLADRVIKP